MIIPIPFQSVNKKDDLPTGTYAWNVTVYKDEDIIAILHEFRLLGDNHDYPICYDLYIQAEDNVAYVADFLRLSDGRWRDCLGLIENQIEDLLPVEMASCAIVSQHQMSDYVLEPL